MFTISDTQNSINQSAFLQLTESEREKLYRDANIEADCTTVDTMNSWGMYQKASLHGPAIISGYMDVATQRRVIDDKIKQLQQQGRLLQQHQFKTADSWIKKSQFGRILGSDYLAAKIHQLSLKRMKVPNKIAVFKETADDKELVMKLFQGLSFDEVESDQLDIYAERIESVDRKLTDEEVDELVRLLDASGYTDLWPENFILAKDGLYFIDTEFKSFAEVPEWGKLMRLTSIVESPEFLQKLVVSKFESTQMHPYEIQNSRCAVIQKIIKFYEKARDEGKIEEENLKFLQKAQEIQTLYKRVGTDVRLTMLKPTKLSFNLQKSHQ